METAKIISFNVWIVLLIFQYQIEDSYCKGKISLKLLEYNNPTGTDAKGDCCDSPVNVPGCSIGKCDHLFRICLLDSTSRSNTSNCLQSTDKTTSDQNIVKFDQNQQNVQFVFDTWKGEAPIKIEVFDSNTDDKKNVLIDQFLKIYNSTKAGFNQTSITAVNFNIIGSRSNNPSSLRFSMSVYCDPQYYGSDCSVKCVPTNKCDGHHTCDQVGNKVCLSGWRGKHCVEQIPGSDVDCSVYTNKTEFSSSEWEGMYSCDNKQHNYPFFLNATKPKDRLTIGATVSFSNITVQVSGTYSRWSKALALQVEISLVYDGHNLTKISLETREISTSGMIGQLSLYKSDGGKWTCIVDPLSLKKAYFDGCDFKGTCVRYGKSKQNYYCCCDDGTIGPSCKEQTTPLSTTTRINALKINTSLEQPHKATKLNAPATQRQTTVELNTKITTRVYHSTKIFGYAAGNISMSLGQSSIVCVLPKNIDWDKYKDDAREDTYEYQKCYHKRNMSLYQKIYQSSLSTIKDTHCKGKISLKLLEYNNPTGTDAKGDCCDSPVNVPGCTIGKCDHLFRICLLDSILDSNTSNCLQSTEIATSDQNVVKFDKNQQNVQFVFDTWKGEAPIKIEVFDSNTDDKKNVLIDQFLKIYNSTKAGFNQTSITAVNFNLIGTRSKNATKVSLRFSLSVYCDPQYYGSDCSIKCVPTNKCDGHYTCDHQGNKVCLTGWRGKDCTELVPGSDVDCSVYQNKTEFSTSEWEGMYSCDNKQHKYPFFLNATKPKDTLTIGATVSFSNITVQVSGTYSSWSKALALQVETSLLYDGHNLTKISLETREISTSGMIGQLSLYKADGGKLTCIVDPLSLKKDRLTGSTLISLIKEGLFFILAYFDGCDFKGTCVRYGKSKQNYYCCCNDGTIGASCTKSTTPAATTTHTTLTTKSTHRPTTTSVESTTTEDTTPIQTTTASTTTPKPTTPTNN
ncbi:unnamed protein product [Mytilus coruscus]|uniref:Delta-like protein n=1 Tax=Mytilus coruscus TaxID=42192 RepID=A0A6J8AIB2_MYTCO|nr:unnamed protein product [Mytilus coruscus]